MVFLLELWLMESLGNMIGSKLHRQLPQVPITTIFLFAQSFFFSKIGWPKKLFVLLNGKEIITIQNDFIWTPVLIEINFLYNRSMFQLDIK